VVVVEETAGQLLVVVFGDLYVFGLDGRWEAVADLCVVELIEVVGVVEGNEAHTLITDVVEPGEGVTVKSWPGL
jgi:hypothetical protein